MFLDWITILSIAAFCLSVTGCLLCNRKNILCWPVWIVADSIFVYLYISNGLNSGDSTLYVGALREFVFILLCFEGFYRWRYKGEKK